MNNEIKDTFLTIRKIENRLNLLESRNLVLEKENLTLSLELARYKKALIENGGTLVPNGFSQQIMIYASYELFYGAKTWGEAESMLDLMLVNLKHKIKLLYYKNQK